MSVPSADQIDRLAQASRERPHDLCPISYHCRRCGASVLDLCEQPRPCLEAENVHSIVPAIKSRALARMVQQLT